MEVQDDYYYGKKPDNKKNCSCFSIAIYVLTILFIFVIGLIVESAARIIILITLPTAIILAIILGIMLLLTLIFMICKCFRRKHLC